ncbi:MAG: phage tail assembly chaperone [Puniceicoccales bacterium]|jgi:hypothetical protein|nr:phage tail assembly chaperone [Puniceicoccales bacterium]
MNEDNLYQYINGNLVELTPDEKAEYQALEAEWASATNARLAKEVRQKRNTLLQESDWAVMRALELGDDFTNFHTYRQQLRNIPSQEGFPSNVTWPSSDLL